MDDTSVINSNPSFGEFSSRYSNAADNMVNLCLAQNLSINANKIGLVLFTEQNKIHVSLLVHFDSTSIPQVKHLVNIVVFKSIHINQKLNKIKCPYRSCKSKGFVADYKSFGGICLWLSLQPKRIEFNLWK